MIIYQVKITIQQEVEEDWVFWMRAVHIPDVIATGLVRNYQFLKPQDTAESVYCINYYFDNQQDYERYVEEFAPQLKQDVIERYPNKFTASRQLFDQI